MKYWIAALVALLFVSNGYWIYKMFDYSSMVNYAAGSANFNANALEQAITIANLNIVGMSADDALELLNPTVHGLAPFEKEGCVNAGTICVELDENRVVVGVQNGVNMVRENP